MENPHLKESHLTEESCKQEKNSAALYQIVDKKNSNGLTADLNVGDGMKRPSLFPFNLNNHQFETTVKLQIADYFLHSC